MADDRLEKVKAEIENIEEEYKGYCYDQHSGGIEEGVMLVCERLLFLIDSLQEEPKEYNGILGENIRKIDNEIQRLERLKENPICAYSTSRYTDVERKVLCEDCEGECEYTKKEPVSEDFKQEYEKYITNHKGEWIREDYEAFAQHFANWQRQKDEHLIWQTSTANYEKGIEEGKQQMMKDAVEAEVEGISKSVLNGSWGYFKVEGNYKNGDKVRVIIIKDE